MPSPGALVAAARQRAPWLDHLVRAVVRYLADGGDRLAAAVTYYLFLSLFPILLLAVSVLGFRYGDDAQQRVTDAVGDFLPENVVDTIAMTLQQARGPAGLLGIVGVLYAGLGWIDALRDGIRTLWHQNLSAGNIVVRKLVDVVVLFGLLATIGTSILTTGLVTTASASVLETLGLGDTTAGRVGTRLLGYALALLADTLLFLYVFGRLSRAATPWRRLLKGAVFGAVAFEVLKVLGGLYVENTTTRGAATYGTFAVVVGLLVFLNLFCRLLLFTAVWMVTAPYDSDVAPSGTSSPEMARKAGIPEHLVGVQTLTEDGARTQLQAALDADPALPQSAAAPPAPVAQSVPAPAQAGALQPGALQPGALQPGAGAVLVAARTVLLTTGLLLVGLAVHVLRTLRGVLGSSSRP